MGIYKGIEVEDSLQTLLPHMHLVDEYRESLQSLQAVWDNLNLLGHLSGTTTEMSNTRTAFAGLTTDLLNNLAARTLSRCVQDISSKAQVCIDILVRNLFERTADIGFLATDAVICEFAEYYQVHRSIPLQNINSRFRAYVDKYSVYADVILLATDGTLLDRLIEHPGKFTCYDKFLQEAISTQAAYVEAYGPSSLFPDAQPRLIYAYRVNDARGQCVGVLCLCFDLNDEMERIFGSLGRQDDWSVMTLLDPQDRIIASSDPYLVPPGARLRVSAGDGCIIRFAGRNYLASLRETHGYQGYMGPGWRGLVLVPLEYAFQHSATDSDTPVATGALLHAILNSDSTFPATLKSIPVQAEAIQRELERSVWNGNVRQSMADKATSNPAFSKILLSEISHTGMRMKDVFARSIGNLQQTVISARLDDCRFLASLAIDIMDRNLYERANDCRWWALDPALSSLLEDKMPAAERQLKLNQRLCSINDLYTVYDNLIIFSREGEILGTSRTQRENHIGTHLETAWAKAALELNQAAHYTVSDFVPTPLYDHRPSYIYAAAFFGEQGKTLGGIGIVFDSEPQFAAMLRDALPSDSPDAFGLFLDAAGRVIASTDERYKVGTSLNELPADLLSASNYPDGTSRLIVLNGQVMAVGVRHSKGYREYKGPADTYRNEVTALIFAPLGEYNSSEGLALPAGLSSSYGGSKLMAGRKDGQVTIEIATFYVGHHWLGLPVREIVEAAELSNFTCIRNAPPQVFGSMIYQSTAIPLYNLRAALGLEDSKVPEEMQVVIINSDEGKRFGVLVDRLADIPEVPVESIEPVSNIFVGVTPVLAAIVKSPNPSDNMLTLLSVASMYALLKTI